MVNAKNLKDSNRGFLMILDGNRHSIILPPVIAWSCFKTDLATGTVLLEYKIMIALSVLACM